MCQKDHNKSQQQNGKLGKQLDYLDQRQEAALFVPRAATAPSFPAP
jgi:hypothetical protein